jgi:hypothetical protein
MDTFNGTWLDQDGATITVDSSNNFATLKYSNGRGPFSGFEIELGSSVVNVDFTDGVAPAAGVQAGVINFDKNSITWSNGTVWKRA